MNDWYMTAPQGKKWSRRTGGKSVTLEAGVWSEEQRRWLNPDEIEQLNQKEG